MTCDEVMQVAGELLGKMALEDYAFSSRRQNITRRNLKDKARLKAR